MSIRRTPVSRCLDKKLLLFGYEVFDLLAVFMLLAILNILFGGTRFELIICWLPPVVLAIFLKIFKKGKPDGYLLHFLRFQIKPKKLSAFSEPTHFKCLSSIKIKYVEKI